MIKHLRKAAVAAAVAGAMAIGVSGSASAYVYGLSHLNVDDLLIVAPASVNSFTFSLTNTATLNAANAIGTANCNSAGVPACGAGPVLDAPAAAVPAGARGGQNNFGFVGPVGNYGSSDSIIYTAQLVSGVPSSSEQIAEAALSSISGQATGNAELRSNTSLSFGVIVGGSSFSLSFNADPDLRAAISELLAGTYNAQANLNASFTFSKDDGSLFVTWSPQGTADNDCFVFGSGSAGVSCTETADTQDLNINVGTGTNPSDQTYSHEAADILTAFGIDITGLTSGRYTLVLNSLTSVDITRAPGQDVPEPGTIALLGLGLLGIAFASTRRRKL